MGLSTSRWDLSILISCIENYDMLVLNSELNSEAAENSELGRWLLIISG